VHRGIPLVCAAKGLGVVGDRFSIVILAGGQSSRLGRHKASVQFGDGTLLSCTAHNVASLTDDIVVVSRADHASIAGDWRVVYDSPPGQGLPAAVAAGLEAAHHDWSFVIGCDMPFVSTALVEHLAGLRGGYQAVIPRCAVGLEPLHSFYRQDVLPSLYDLMLRGERRLSLLEGVIRALTVPEAEWRAIDHEGRSFYNINTPQDLARAARWIERSPKS